MEPGNWYVRGYVGDWSSLRDELNHIRCSLNVFKEIKIPTFTDKEINKLINETLWKPIKNLCAWPLAHFDKLFVRTSRLPRNLITSMSGMNKDMCKKKEHAYTSHLQS